MALGLLALCNQLVKLVEKVLKDYGASFDGEDYHKQAIWFGHEHDMYDASSFVVLDTARQFANMISYSDLSDTSVEVNMKTVDCGLQALGNANVEQLAEMVDR